MDSCFSTWVQRLKQVLAGMFMLLDKAMTRFVVVLLLSVVTTLCIILAMHIGSRTLAAGMVIC